jgi:hypothetical protein
MKKTTTTFISKLIADAFFKTDFVDVGEPTVTPRILRRDEQYAMFTCQAKYGNVRVGLMGGYFNSLAKSIIEKVKPTYNFHSSDNLPNIASFVGENVDYSHNIDHFSGLLDVCAAASATSGQIILPNSTDDAVDKISKAMSIFSTIFSEVLPQLDNDLPCVKVPRYLYNSTSLPTLISCFARSIELGCATEQFDHTSNLLLELSAFHFPKCEQIIPTLREYI